MIVSHAHRFIFLAVPKTASQSIRRALRPHLGPEDWEQCSLFEQRRAPIAALARRRHGHLSVRDVRPHIGDEVWRSYFKFAFVRNPWDRFVSIAFFLRGGNRAFLDAPRDGMKRLAVQVDLTRRLVARDQHEILMDSDGAIAVDLLGRYETLEESFGRAMRRVGLTPPRLTPANASTHASYWKYYDAELKELVAERYAQDVARFDYAFEPGARPAARAR